MEPTNKPFIKKLKKSEKHIDSTIIEFLPDADEVERSPLSLIARVTLYVLASIFVGFIIWSNIYEVNQVVVAEGKLVTSSPNIIVQPLETSIIERLHVRTGQVVKKGTLLASLDPTFVEADKEQLQKKLQSLDIQFQRLDAELSGRESTNKRGISTDSLLQSELSVEREANFKAQLSKLEASVSRLDAAIKTNLRDQKLLKSRFDVMREMETMKKELVEQQSLAKVNLLEAQEKRLLIEQQMENAINYGKELENEMASVLAEKNAFVNKWRQNTMEELLKVSRERDALREQLEKADKRHNMVELRSPANAVVLEIAKLSEGSVIRGAETLFTLVPLDATLSAEVHINSNDIGFVKVGNEVQLKLSAFPFQRHGTLEGELDSISEGAFQPNVNIGETGGSYYLGGVQVKSLELKDMAHDSKLLPGMTLTAEIIVGKRSVIAYLLWPINKTLDDGV